MSNSDQQTSEPASTPTHPLQVTFQGSPAVLLTFLLAILISGFLLGFVRALLDRDVAVADALVRGIWIAPIFLLAIVAGGTIHTMGTKFGLNPWVIGCLWGMTTFGMLYAFGGWVKGEERSVLENMLRGMGNGFIIGPAIHAATLWQQKRRQARLTDTPQER
ncbi:MAG: hypothetical protein AAF539_12510 [Planctomycetota bacterium]